MEIWNQCRSRLKGSLTATEYNTWILPLQAATEDGRIILYAPNQFVRNRVKQHYQQKITELCTHLSGGKIHAILFEIGSLQQAENSTETARKRTSTPQGKSTNNYSASNLITEFTFDTFIEGKSNQIARAAATQIGENPGVVYNPLFIYGGVGLGKTHLMHAVGNMVSDNSPSARVVYLHSERFVTEMVKSLQHNRIDEFKKNYRTVNALLIDDIQFFAGKERSQEEFFHTFNALFESKQQIVLSSDRFPKEVNGLEERLKSRFGWGLTVAVEPPDLETRVAILKSKAIHIGTELPEDVAFFVGRRIRSNIRDLEGALRRLVANSQFTGTPINLEFARNVLQDMLAAQDKQVTLENIQKTVAEYYKIRVTDMLSSKRNRSIARPRQIAMALAKELTKHSLPEIGSSFSGRDHTTVLHATKKIKDLRKIDRTIEEDYRNLLRTLTA
ncbi:MAG: chromosomal replication initiator protein DnaA [Candidatus Thiosymbion ectosymbiont of Robbea hypermnestra]|nr:chromosomal replication initiator protein DnaA [Candidatus Thiosymbion ectosymbiont of Robbea hypermnestra]